MLLLRSEKGNPRLRQVIKSSKKIRANNIATAKHENLANAPPWDGVSEPFRQPGSDWFRILYQSPPLRHSVNQASLPSPGPADLQLEQGFGIGVH